MSYKNNVAIRYAVKFGMSLFGRVMLIPYLMVVYLLHSYYNLKTKCDRPNRLHFFLNQHKKNTPNEIKLCKNNQPKPEM